VLFSATGSGRPTPGLAEPLWSLPGVNGFVLGSGQLYAVEPGGGTLSARDRVTGEVRWRLDVAAASALLLEVGRGVLAIATGSPDATVLFVAETTGAVIGASVGQPWARTDGLLLLFRAPSGCHALDCLVLAGVDVTTGRDVWAVPLPKNVVPDRTHDDQAGPVERVNRFAVVDDDGAIVVYSAVTGEPTRRLTMPVSAGDETFALVDDLVLTAVRASGEVVVSAYPMAPSARAWSVTVPVNTVIHPEASYVDIGRCARLLCVRVDGRTAFLDPGSGALVGRINGLVITPRETDPRVMLATVALVITGGLVNHGVIVLSASDATVLTLLPSTAITPWVGGRGRWLVTTEGPAGTTFTTVDASGKDRAIGTVPGDRLTCQASDDLLACAGTDGGLGLWRLPPA
jgi:hypothetical protein